MPYYLDLTPRGNKKIDSKNKFNHDGGFQQKFQQKKPRNQIIQFFNKKN